jgi:hypothetical protein
MIGQLILRFVVGGALVAVFALLGDMFAPKSFAGLFAGAPSVALATIILTVETNGAVFASIEARSMVLGGAAFAVYAAALAAVLHRRKARPLAAALALLPIWFVLAAGAYALVLRRV